MRHTVQDLFRNEDEIRSFKPIFFDSITDMPVITISRSTLVELVNKDKKNRVEVTDQNYRSKHVPFTQLVFSIDLGKWEHNSHSFYVVNFNSNDIFVEVYPILNGIPGYFGIYQVSRPSNSVNDAFDVTLLKGIEDDKNNRIGDLHESVAQGIGSVVIFYLMLSSITKGIETKSKDMSDFSPQDPMHGGKPKRSMIKLHTTEQLQFNRDPVSDIGTRKAEHQVRGHWRKLRSGNKTWVRSHKRGDPKLGIVKQEYVV